MNQIDRLIADLAPNGVNSEDLGDVGEFVRGNGLQKSDLTDEGIPAIHYGQLHTHYGVWAAESKSFTRPELAARLRRARTGDLVIATTSEDDAAVGKATAWLGTSDVVVGGDAYIYRHRLDPLFVAYYFSSGQFQQQKRRHITGTKVRRVSANSLAKIRIPVPPLEVQQVIARTLDQFNQRELELEQTLLSEYEARALQRIEYRSQALLHIDSYDPVSLRDVADFFNAKAHENLVDPSGSVALLTPRFISTDGRMARYINAIDVRTPALKDDVALVMSDLPGGRALSRTFFVDADGKYAANQRVCLLRSLDKEVLLPKFLFHVLDRAPQLLAYDNGTDQTHLRKAQIEGLRFGLPPIEEQRRLAELLDKLDAASREIAAAISAERVDRRQQYQYYRDKLLTFREAAA